MKKGFTLAEVLVALGVFSVIVTIAVGAFTNALRTQREVAALVAAESNSSLTLEQIAREVRTGYYFCTMSNSTLANQVWNPACQACNVVNGNVNNNKPNTVSCPVLDFWNAHGCEVTYFVSSSTGALMRNDVCDATTPQAITSENVVVRSLSFTLFGNLMDDEWDPRVTISMNVGAKTNDPAIASTTLNMQTTVSARDCGSLAGGC